MIGKKGLFFVSFSRPLPLTEGEKNHIMIGSFNRKAPCLSARRGERGRFPYMTQFGKVNTAMAKQYKLTPERLQELQEELTYLKTVREREVAEQIKEARSFGDLSENSEYDEAKNEQGKLYSRIAEVEEILANYVVITEHDFAPDAVSLGAQVKVLDEEFNEESTYRIVGSQEADPMNGRISEDSPFGKALLGKEVGDEVEVEAPAGVLKYKILDIQKN